MEYNNKKLSRTSKFLNIIIAVALCIFLISLSNKILSDVESWQERPTVESFENKELIESHKASIKEIQIKIDSVQEDYYRINKTLKIAQDNYSNKKESYNNWLAARKTIGSPNEDKEIITRAKDLDAHFNTVKAWKEKERTLQDVLSELKNERTDEQSLISEEENKAYLIKREFYKKSDLKVFLIRLLIILPILILGLFFLFKFRKHKYWPLFLGFVLFSFYAFFFGLIPYLPSYGGYIRYTVGIVLILVLGIYAINKIRSFIEKKKQELEVSKEERSKHVQTDTAEKALNQHMCPSCGKDFLLKTWDKPTTAKKPNFNMVQIASYCRFCGLELFKKCTKCNTENFAHLPFCSCCGDNIQKQEKQ